MKARPLFIAAVVFFTFFSPTAWAINGSIGSGTVPPSSVRSGLIRSPNPIDTTGNRLITGNVRGGRHFRGVVPYRAPSDFGARLGSSSLYSFLRDSAGSQDFGRFSRTDRPYYLPSRTVTTTMPGRSGVFRPPTARIAGRAESPEAISTLPPLPKQKTLSDGETTISDSIFRPMSMTTRELEKVLLSEVKKYQQGREPISIDSIGKQRRWEVEQFRRSLKQVSDRAAELKQGLMTGRDDSLQLPTKGEPSEDVPQGLEPRVPKEQIDEDKQFDIYEQMKWRIDDLQKTLEQLSEAKQSQEAVDGYKESGEQEPYFTASPVTSRKMETQQSSQADRLSEVSLSAVRAKAILGEHKTFASFSKDKFNEYLKAAEDYLKQGRYYRAADAYTLASIYKPDDPLAYAGKSHALFVAGEYMSSALFLARALEIFPEYARFKIDVEVMVGDRDKLESRVVDVEQLLKKNDVPELQFLLSYVYYRMGRLDRAKKAINAAYEKMPQSRAVTALKKAIDEHESGG